VEQSFILLADHATVHPEDRTLTVVRSGISEIAGQPPVTFGGYVVAWHRSSEESIQEAVAFEVRGHADNVIQKIEYPLEAKIPAMATRCYVAKLAITFAQLGGHRVVLLVRGVEKAFMDFNVKARNEAKQ